jgi:hypothetical protein
MSTFLAAMLFLQAGAAVPAAQQGHPMQPGFPGSPVGHRPKVEIPWNRFYSVEEIYGLLDRIQAAFPHLVSHQVIGSSYEKREMRVYTVTNAKKGADGEKPAMWIDGNVHGNEVQGGEAAVYAVWYATENYGSNPEITELLDRSVLYVLPMQNPDGRAHWFAEAHDAHSSRTGYMPTDDDLDGLYDEDPDDDLDGDNHITQMRKFVPGQGTHRLLPDDPRILERVPANDKGIRGDWILLGDEGIDNDGDGRINEDPRGGYDMNRAWPSMWQPEYVQGGAGPYPLYWPESLSIARFILAHPNIAAVQSFHNSGGMILRGPGAESFGEYPAADVRVYDELGRDGERMLPFYRYMVIWKDLYTVFGGFVTWTYEGLGILSFTNELWSSEQYFPDKSKNPDPGRNFFGTNTQEQRLFFNDKLLMGDGFVDWHPFEHPLYGAIEIGGFKKDVGRVPPTFLIEEMIHRNALFCLKHAREMPLVSIEEPTVVDLGDGIRAVDVVFKNQRLIPTRTARAAGEKIGEPDVYTLTGKGVEVLAGGFRTDRWRPERIEIAKRDPARLLREDGIPGRGEVRVRWIVRGGGQDATVGFEGEKAQDASLKIRVR